MYLGKRTLNFLYIIDAISVIGLIAFLVGPEHWESACRITSSGHTSLRTSPSIGGGGISPWVNG